MKKPNNLIIRNIAPAEMELVVAWAAREGWNPGLRDAECFLAEDTSGYFIAEADGKPVGCIFGINFSADLCMGGVFIVNPEYRGGRIGVELQKRAALHAGKRTVGFDAVEYKVKNYGFFGFKPAYKIVRYEMLARPAGKDIETVDLTAYPFDKFNAYDRKFFPADRSRLMGEWIKQKPAGAALGIIANGALAGYGVIRKAYHGYRVEPLYAESREIAENLLLALVGRVEPGVPVYINIPLPNSSACALAQKYEMKPAIMLVRMYNRIMTDTASLANIYSQMG
ncbi:MAG: GNAT family N-acetyltransferase [Elusimicrobiota bacterium]